MDGQNNFSIQSCLRLLEYLLPYDELIKGIDVTQVATAVEEVFHTITPKEQRVLEQRFGLRGGISRSLESIGIEFNVSRERIRQIQIKALRRLAHPVRRQRLRTVVISLMMKDLIKELREMQITAVELKTALSLKEKEEQLTTRVQIVSPCFNESIDTLGLTTRVRKCLIRGGKNTVGEVAQLSDKDLLRLRGFGLRCLREVRETLARKLEGCTRQGIN